jgi:predicted DNA-binding protein YlxM (UPF0122 family)
MAKKNFNLRSLTAFLLFSSLVIEIVSGVVLYVVPPGRIANWTNWKLWGLSKDGWGALHTIFGYLFLAFAVLHIYYNWRPIVHYIKSKVKVGLKMRREFVISLIITIVFFVGTVLNVSPFSNVMDFGSKLKNSWADSEKPPPIPHAELLKFQDFTKEFGFKEKDALDILKKKGILIENKNMTIKKIAEENDISPETLYQILRESFGYDIREDVEEEEEYEGKGYGKKTVKTVSDENGVPVKEALELLKIKGIDAKEDDSLKEIADKYKLTPGEIADMIKLEPK